MINQELRNRIERLILKISTRDRGEVDFDYIYNTIVKEFQGLNIEDRKEVRMMIREILKLTYEEKRRRFTDTITSAKKVSGDLVKNVEGIRKTKIINTGIAKSTSSFITDAGEYNYTHKFVKGGGRMIGGELYSSYRGLIGRKVLEQDPKLLSDIISDRKRMLQHRITCEVTLIAKGTAVLNFKVISILIEDGQEIVDFWQGLDIDTNYIHPLIKQCESVLISKAEIHKISDVVVRSQGKFQVQDVLTRFTFA